MDNWKDIFPKKNRFYETDNGILYKEDSLNLLKGYSNESVDLILIDPPYYMGKKPFINKNKKYKRVVEEWDNIWTTKEEYMLWVEKWLKESKRILKEKGRILVFGSFHNAMDIKVLMDKYFTFRNFLTWFKPNAMPIMMAKNSGVYAYSCEYINYYSKGKVGFFNYDYLKNINDNKQYRDLFIINNRSNSESVGHPTQKPIKLIKQLLTTHLNTNEIVLDFFIGSGTTAFCSEQLGRRWVGIELNPEYCEISKQRIQNYLNEQKSKLF